jgi:hypothetical protein
MTAPDKSGNTNASEVSMDRSPRQKQVSRLVQAPACPRQARQVEGHLDSFQQVGQVCGGDVSPGQPEARMRHEVG